jgi:hypothetical protein
MGLPAWAQYVVNAGQTVTVYSSPSTPYVINDPLGITINGMLRVLERPDGGGAITANGGILQLLSPGGFITIGNGGSVNASAYTGNGYGGTVTMTAPTLTVNGLIQANGLGTGNGGTINLNGTTINVQSLGNIQARGAGTAGLGGVLNITGSGVVTLANGSQISTVGASSATKNVITISGTGVNLDGIVNAQANSVGNGGKISVTSTAGGNQILISSTGRLQAQSNTGTGGTILLTGNTNINGGQLTANTGANSRNGGTITISGGNTNSFTIQGSGIVNANGKTNGTNSRGGNITINTGTVTLSQGTIQAEGSYSGGGGGGAVNITATGGALNVNNGHTTKVLGDTGGSLSVSSTAGAVTVNDGGWLRSQGDSTTTLNLSGRGVTVAGTVEAGGWQDGGGGTLTINSSSTNDFTLSPGGILSAIGGSSAATAGGTINLTASRNIILTGADSGADLNRPNDANIRAYGVQVGGAGALGNGGVINLTSTGSYSANQYVTINAKGTTVKSASTYSKGVINITAGTTANIDGINQVGGRLYSNGGGGAIKIQSAGNMTINPTALIGATISSMQNNATGDGGRIDLIATGAGANININGGNSIVSGIQRGFVDFRSGVTGDGGTLVVNSQNGNVFLSGALLRGDSTAGLGGVINLIATNTLSINSLSVLTTSGGTTSARNLIDLQGGTLSLTGTLNAASTVGKGGYIKITDNSPTGTYSATFSGGPTYNVAGVGQNGTLHFKGHAITTGQALTHSNGTLILEATNGLVNINDNITARDIQFISNGASGGITLGGTNANNVIRAVDSSNNAGTITANTTGTLNLVSSTTLDVRGGAAGKKGGTVTLTSSAGTVLLDNTTYIYADGHTGGGTGGTVTMNGYYGITIGTDSLIYARGMVASNSYTGNGGSINYNSTAGSLSYGARTITDVSSVSQGLFAGSGVSNNAGTIGINVHTNAIMAASSQLLAKGATYSGASSSSIKGGNGGTITMAAPASIRFRNLSVVNVSGGNGVGGNANGGNGGNINMTTPSLQLTNTAQEHFLVSGGLKSGTGTNGTRGNARNNNQLLF